MPDRGSLLADVAGIVSDRGKQEEGMEMIRLAWEGKLELSDEVIAEAEQCCWEAIRA